MASTKKTIGGVGSSLTTKTITNYGLLIDGEFIKFPTKEQAIEIGRIAYRINNSVKLIEKYVLWHISSNVQETSVIDKQEFDRTILIK